MLSTKAKIRIARTLSTAIVGARTALACSPHVTVRRGGIVWRLDLREGIDLAIYLRLYQRIPQRLTRDWLKPNSVVLDIGANIGSHGLPLARQLGPGGRVICIEPTDYAFAKLKANAALNPNLADRLILLQAALTDKSAETMAPGQTDAAAPHSRATSSECGWIAASTLPSCGRPARGRSKTGVAENVCPMAVSIFVTPKPASMLARKSRLCIIQH